MDRRAHLRLDLSQSQARSRLRAIRQHRRCLRPPRHDPDHAQTLDQDNSLPLNQDFPNRLLGALLGFAGVALLAFGRGVSFTGTYALGYVLALGCAFTWSLYSVLSRRFGETPTDAIAAFCAVSAALSLGCHLLFERTVWPASTTAWLAVLALGLGPAGTAFYLWDHAVKRGDIRALGALSYATPILSTALLIVCGLAEPTGTLLIAALLVTVGAVLASRELWRR